MRLDQFPEDIRPYLLPEPKGEMVYRCLGCHGELGIERLLYTCPECGSVLMLENKKADRLQAVGGDRGRRIFDFRRMLNEQSLKGIFRYYEFIAPVIPLDHIVYLGEGHTPLVEANRRLKKQVGADFFFKISGLNPRA